jgi:AcrR family transcriptional regulator
VGVTSAGVAGAAAAGRRLAPAARRDQILDVGAEQFAARPYEQVHIADVAALAGISRALVYRYFPTKRDLFAGVYARASERLLAANEIVPGLTLAEQVLAGLDAHFDFFVENARTVLVANRGALAGDPVIEGIISEELAELRRRMLDAGGLHGRERVRASIALSGWLAFVRAVCVEWLADPDQTLTREDAREMCLSTLISSLGRQTAQTTTPEME